MTQNTTHKDRIEKLRILMEQEGVVGFIVPRADEWQGEFVAEYAERLRWISNFTGSGGCAVILKDIAALLTDSRYTLQAEVEVDRDIFEVVNYIDTPIAKWIAAQDVVGAVAFDPRLHTPKQLQDLRDQGIALRPVDNMIDKIWADQPDAPATQVELFPQNIAGQSYKEKLYEASKALVQAELDYFVITLPDSIAWLLNIRARDTRYIPVALSYLLLDRKGGATWFIDPARTSFNLDQVIVKHPKYMQEELNALAQGARVGLDFKRSADWFRLTLEQGGAQIVDLKDPTIDPKAIKNASEQKAIRAAHIHDGVAVTRFLAWIDREVLSSDLTELSVAQKLREFRAQSPDFIADSFPTISGFGPNGAVVHYRATKMNNAPINGDGLLLVDSGGQYGSGTTDITRTVLVGAATQEMKENFTRVLQGHIAVAMSVFKAGTLGKEIDALARAPLKAAGLDFAHGTGHGVGCFLAVHEEAASLSPRGEDALCAGMLLSNEPGYYKAGEYGIRIENLVFVQEAGGERLKFETVSFAPIDRRLIVKNMLSEDEILWLNDYHSAVKQKIAPHLDDVDRQWLSAQAAPL